jgi:hypothetical protein
LLFEPIYLNYILLNLQISSDLPLQETPSLEYPVTPTEFNYPMIPFHFGCGYFFHSINYTTMNGQTASKTITISILRIEENNDDLIMSDGGETHAKRSDKIVWDIASDSGVEEITNIQRKPNSEDVFEPNEQPRRENGTKKWKGKIKGQMNVPKTEDYTIYYTKTGGGEGIYDPKIQVNS